MCLPIYLTVGSKVKRMSWWYVTHQSYGQADTYQIAMTYLKIRCYGPDKLRWETAAKTNIPNIIDLSLITKKLWSEQAFLQIFYLGVKGQGQTDVMFVRDTPSYGHEHTYQRSLTYLDRQNCYCPDNLHQLFNLYLTFGSKVNVKQMSWWYATDCLLVLHPYTKYHWPILK